MTNLGGRDQSLPLRSTPEGKWLIGLYGFTVVAILGYGTFGLNPGRIPNVPALFQFYSISFNFFAQAHIWLCLVVLGVALVRHIGWSWLPALAAVYLLSFTSEHVGTGYGIPFGGYAYTELLGPRVGPRVPLVIPLSWFLMALPSYLLALVTFPAPGRRLARIFFASLLLMTWDLALDPAMSYLTPYWRWEDTGPYYGMPWLNLLGWYVTGLVIITAIDRMGGTGWGSRLSTRWMLLYYLGVLLMPLGMILVAGLWLGVVVTLVGLALAWGIHSLVVTSRRSKAGSLAGAAGEGA
jgi:uncharacterized membrane protein